MDKSAVLKTFNTHLFEFIDDLITIFPECKDLGIARKSLDTIRRLNATLIIKVWQTSVYLPYKELIDAGNMDFFLEKDYQKDLGAMSNGNEILKVIDLMRDQVRSMTEVNKDHSMKYLQNLSKLATLYSM
jgi:hypothetical protein